MARINICCVAGVSIIAFAALIAHHHYPLTKHLDHVFTNIHLNENKRKSQVDTLEGRQLNLSLPVIDTPDESVSHRRFFEGGTELDRALSISMLPPISTKCRNSSNHDASNSKNESPLVQFNVTMDFISSNGRSEWSPTNAMFEKDIFLLEMTFNHKNNVSMTSIRSSLENGKNAVNVTLRLGTGGNIYSYYIEDHLGRGGSRRGKETVPPQAHVGSPFNDEVWQFVSVNSQKNDQNTGPGHYKYFIHQAGTYLRDPNGGLGLNGGENGSTANTTTRPFSSPTVAYYCNETESSCTVLSWGQHAHVPTIHKSNVLYTTRYVACDLEDDSDDVSVVIEVTNGLTVLIDPDNEENGDSIDYINVPWGGIRQSTMRDVLVSGAEAMHHGDPKGRNNENHGKIKIGLDPSDADNAFQNSTLLHKPLMGNSFNDANNDTGGYFTFAQRVYDPDMKSFYMPCVNTSSHLEVPCPTTQSGKKEVVGNDTDFIHGKSLLDLNTFSQLDDTNPYEEDLHDVIFRADMGSSYESTATKRDWNTFEIWDEKEDSNIVQLRLVVSRTAKTPFFHHDEHQLFLPRREYDKQTDLTLALEPTVEFHGSCSGCVLFLINKRTSFRAVVGTVYVWARNGGYLHFVTPEGGGDPVKAASFFNKHFSGGDEIIVEFVNNGMPHERNMAISIVTGNQYHPDFEYRPGSERIAPTPRDYTVYEGTKLIHLHPGTTYFKRHHLVNGHLDQADETATKWVDEVIEGVRNDTLNEKATSEHIVLHSNVDGTIVGVTVGGNGTTCGPPGSMTLQRCQGYSSPMPNTVRLFAIECGTNETYIGSDMYHFAPKEPMENDTGDILFHRPYICDGQGIEGPRPRWKLLGFFPKGSCSSTQSASFDQSFCNRHPA